MGMVARQQPCSLTKENFSKSERVFAGVRTMWTRSVVPFARKYSLGLSSKYERGHAEDMVPCKEFFGAAMVSFSALKKKKRQARTCPRSER